MVLEAVSLLRIKWCQSTDIGNYFRIALSKCFLLFGCCTDSKKKMSLHYNEVIKFVFEKY